MSSGAFSWADVKVTPGWTGNGLTATRLQVYELASGTPLAETIFPALDSSVPALVDGGYLNFGCDDGAGTDIGFFVIVQQVGFGAPPAVPAPDPTEHESSGVDEDEQCIWVSPGRPWSRWFRVDQSYRVLQVSGVTAFLRVEMTSTTF